MVVPAQSRRQVPVTDQAHWVLLHDRLAPVSRLCQAPNMAAKAPEKNTSPDTARAWYSASPQEVATSLDVDPDTGLTAEKAASLLQKDGPNALPRRNHDLAGCASSTSTAAICRSSWWSPLSFHWSSKAVAHGCTSAGLTVVNAVVGLQEGKAESAMNALKSMMKATARVRRDSTESEIPAEQLVVGDIVLLAAGDQVPADGHRFLERPTNRMSLP